MGNLSFQKIRRWKKPTALKKAAYETEYQIVIEERGQQWKKVLSCDRKQLEAIKLEIEEILNSDTVAERLHISDEHGAKIEEHCQADDMCRECKCRMTSDCITCLFELDSPLERKLYGALRNEGIYFKPQYPLNRSGKRASPDDTENSQTGYINLLTKVDFLIEKKTTRLCVYTDGHSYHERTEEQAMKDKNIDRKLQDLGFKVLRYTGKEINEHLPKVISEIKTWLNKESSEEMSGNY